MSKSEVHLSDEEKIIEKAYKESLLEPELLAHHIKKYYGLSIQQSKIHTYLKNRGLYPSTEKKEKMEGNPKMRSLSLVHAGWFQFQDKKVIAFLDDASRYILALGEFDSAESENAIKVLKEAESVASSVNSVIETLVDRVSSSTINRKGKKGENLEFQTYVEKKGIKTITTKNTFISNKLTRWIRECKKHRNRFESAEKYKTWYNRRIHGALNLKIGETPEEAFIRRLEQ
ncbi:MAG: hypothetical protein HXS48_05995 [Theionarchaea archaeon]|nr:hypothetical protein [Theionarchaea archaeon]